MAKWNMKILQYEFAMMIGRGLPNKGYVSCTVLFLHLFTNQRSSGSCPGRQDTLHRKPNAKAAHSMVSKFAIAGPQACSLLR